MNKKLPTFLDLAKSLISYLTNRKQRLKFHNCIGSALTMCIGVPQGTVWGPVVFILDIIRTTNK